MSVLYVNAIKTLKYAVLGSLSVKDDINDAKTNKQVKAPINLKVSALNVICSINIFQFKFYKISKQLYQNAPILKIV